MLPGYEPTVCEEAREGTEEEKKTTVGDQSKERGQAELIGCENPCIMYCMPSLHI